ncbi:hypothetical protein GOV04_01785 [Candidatus Woesearchaeota archaeon]|nr:hypothetical protein [Candidatus Woesearchaeota archaeon]
MKQILLFAIILVLLATSSFAFGVSAPYWDTRPLELSPGQNQEVILHLQNMVGNDNITVIASLNSDPSIARLIDDITQYTVNAKTKGLPVNLLVSIPKKTSIGTMYQVKILFSPVIEQASSDNIQIVGAIEKTFPVIVVESESSKPSKNLIIITSIVTLLALITIIVKFYLLKKAKKRVK